MKAAVIAMLLLPVAAATQTVTIPRAASPDHSVALQSGSHVYTNPALQLTFTYPASLAPRDPNLAAIRRVIYGEDTSPDSDARNLPLCAATLLSVGTEHPPAAPHPAPPAALATITLLDVDARCLPPKASHNRKAMDEALTRLTVQGTTVLGMMPIEQRISYSLQGHRFHFAAAQGTPVTPGGLQTSAPRLIAVATTAVNGHVLCWIIEAGGLPLFNHLLASPVGLGEGPTQPLFPSQFSGSDEPAPSP